MSVSKYFNHTPTTITQEQNVIEDLIVEQIKLWGTDLYYMPRTPVDKLDPVYGEDPISTFNAAYQMEMYINEPTGDSSSVDFFSKFGLELRTRQKLIVARRTFLKYVKGNYTRPKEGDLIYVPTFNNLYEIKYVNENNNFYLLGRKAPFFYTYELEVELHKFSHDRFNTGVQLIDNIAREYGYSITVFLTPPGNSRIYQVGETVFQGPNVAFATASAKVGYWNKQNTSIDITNIVGVFANANTVIGATSNAQYIISSYNRQAFAENFEDITNNADVEGEGEKIINFTTRNPFGDP